MRCFVFLIAVFVFAASPAFAAKKKAAPAASPNSITVIQDDGTAVTIELEPVDPILPGAGAVGEQPAEAAPGEKPDQFDMPVKAAAPEKPVVQSAGKPAKPQKARQEKTSKQQSSKKKKPAPPRVPTQKSAGAAVPPGGEIAEDAAVAIALEVAPPSNGYNVSRRTYQGANVYVVTFKGEEGPHDILIEAATGKILLNASVAGGAAAPPLPGHLPADWEPFKPVPVGPPVKK